MGADDLPITLMAGSMPKVPLPTFADAAAAAGFTGVTLWPNMWMHAYRKLGMDLADCRALLDGRGLRVVAVEAVYAWVPGKESEGHSPEALLDAATILGAATLVAVHLGESLDMQRDADALGRLCRQAESFGVAIALEPVSFTPVATTEIGLALVTGCGEANAGLVIDLLHHIRADGVPEDLVRLDPQLVRIVQLSDGRASAPPDLRREALFERLLPGEGDLPLVESVHQLYGAGFRGAIGPEAYQTEFDGAAAHSTAQRLFTTSQSVVTRAISKDVAGHRLPSEINLQLGEEL